MTHKSAFPLLDTDYKTARNWLARHGLDDDLQDDLAKVLALYRVTYPTVTGRTRVAAIVDLVKTYAETAPAEIAADLRSICALFTGENA